MSARVVAVTTTACSSEKPAGSAESLPAAITAIAPFDHAYSTASQNAQPRTPCERPPAEAEVDDVGAVVGGPPDPGGDVVGGPGGRAGVAVLAGVLEHADRQEAGAGRDAGHSPAVVGGGERDAGHVGAVAVVVLTRPSARRPRSRPSRCS